MVQNLKKTKSSKISKNFSFLRHEVPFKANNNREAVVVCARHVVKRPSKRSVLVIFKLENFEKKSHSRCMKCRPKANNNREAVVVCARHVVKRPSKRMRASLYIYIDIDR